MSPGAVSLLVTPLRIVSGCRPLLDEILWQTDPVGAKTPIFNRYSLVAPHKHLAKIPLQLIKINRTKQKNAEQIDQINRIGTFEGYSVVSITQILSQ